jgi:hypothetical protein
MLLLTVLFSGAQFFAVRCRAVMRTDGSEHRVQETGPRDGFKKHDDQCREKKKSLPYLPISRTRAGSTPFLLAFEPARLLPNTNQIRVARRPDWWRSRKPIDLPVIMIGSPHLPYLLSPGFGSSRASDNPVCKFPTTTRPTSITATNGVWRLGYWIACRLMVERMQTESFK